MQESPEEGRSPDSSNIFNITIEGFRKLEEVYMDLNSLFVLECITKGIDLEMQSHKIRAYKQSLQRRGFITENGTISLIGNDILRAVVEGKIHHYAVLEEKAKIETSFDRWWKAYPATDVFEYKGKKFSGTRGLKVKMKDCKMKLTRILNEGKYTIEELIASLECEVNMKKEASIRDGENKMRFMVNSLSYLNQGLFENFMELSKSYKPTDTNNQIFGI